jgi:hypothetical protein
MAKSIFKRDTNVIIVVFCGIAIFICAAVVIDFYAIDGPSFQQGQERASVLIKALEQYKEDFGKYPSNLTQLIPEYLSSIPRPAWRYEYDYTAYRIGSPSNPLENYEIVFRLRGNADDWCCYGSEMKEWECYDSYPRCK